MPERFTRVVNRRLARSGVTLRDVDTSSTAAFRRDVQIIKGLYNRCWEKNWGFVQATSAEFDHAAKDLKMLLVPYVSCIAERGGEPVGFSVFIRDLNTLLKGTSGRLTPIVLWRLLTGLKKVRHMRCVLLGVVPEARGGAINEAMFLHGAKHCAAHGMAGAEAGWILADNKAMTSPIEASGGQIVKRYRMYETR